MRLHHLSRASSVLLLPARNGALKPAADQNSNRQRLLTLRTSARQLIEPTIATIATFARPTEEEAADMACPPSCGRAVSGKSLKTEYPSSMPVLTSADPDWLSRRPRIHFLGNPLTNSILAYPARCVVGDNKLSSRGGNGLARFPVPLPLQSKTHFPPLSYRQHLVLHQRLLPALLSTSSRLMLIA
ncbi:hypothetical protein K505DRAFT_164625 [Melanomma pulvis-pyrius CBS 109.77]|uniref:Uncharacterized protein n=1 Tax=Melanomma pulvis-pyrius CBS 109.77 TaxID=1314802 RepID=A0A6A6XIR6_9PLEO|nr:hypothetical protein K505DRAFT_164625 [Melanomma pulvis-pyrius CBS 109.77]